VKRQEESLIWPLNVVERTRGTAHVNVRVIDWLTAQTAEEDITLETRNVVVQVLPKNRNPQSQVASQ
jgi:hypothetical protein